MKIRSAKVFSVEGVKYNWTLLKLETESGLVGWGEGTNWPGSPLVQSACEHVGEILVGQDCRRIDFLWTKLYRDMHWLGQAGPLLSAISAADIALWDLKGKALGAPVYELLGGAYRKQIPLYANYWFLGAGHTPAAYGEQAAEVAKQGYAALKLDPFAHIHYVYGEDLAVDGTLTAEQKNLAVEVVAAVAAAVGSDFPIAIETHAFLNAPTAVEMAHRLAEINFRCMWYEEPALPEFVDSIADIRRQIPFPVCIGERLHSRFMMKTALDKQAMDFVMPDITRCGGITEMRKMANLAETYNVPFAPHNPNGPLSTISSAHVMATIPNAFRQEIIFSDVPWRDSCLSHPLPVNNGSFQLSDRPGLGFDVKEEELLKHPGLTQKPSDREYYI